MWVRDFARSVITKDINNLIPRSDYDIFLKNEMINATMNLASIDAETIYAPNVVIVSDGYQFEKKQHLLKGLNATIIGTNRALAKWDKQNKMDWYVVNNPYKDCLTYLGNYYPRCIASNRTNPEFIQRYKSRRGVLYRYTPVTDGQFSSHYFPTPAYYIDDYRNPICAAISLAFRWEVQNLLLFCCDSSFEDERPGAYQQSNGLWAYPTPANGLVDGCLYWLNREHLKVNVYNHSSVEYENSKYICLEEINGRLF